MEERLAVLKRDIRKIKMFKLGKKKVNGWPVA
jgi:hypothetical protein